MPTVAARRRVVATFRGHILIAQRKDFREGQDFLRLFERGDVLQDSLRFTVSGDDQWFPLLRQARQNLRSVGFEIADEPMRDAFRNWLHCGHAQSEKQKASPERLA